MLYIPYSFLWATSSRLSTCIFKLMDFFTHWQLGICSYIRVSCLLTLVLTLCSSPSAHRKLFKAPNTSHTISCFWAFHTVFFWEVFLQVHFPSPYSFFRTRFPTPSKDGFTSPTSELIYLVALMLCLHIVYSKFVSPMTLEAPVPQWLMHQLFIAKCPHMVDFWEKNLFF